MSTEAVMDLGLSPRGQEILDKLQKFMTDEVYPAEAVFAEQSKARSQDDHSVPAVVEDLKIKARDAGLWNLFLPDISGLSNLEYAYIAELTGRSPYIAPRALNCSAPDTGNMEILHLFGSDEIKRQWLDPLLDGTIRSAFAMTEPDVASSDARNIQTSITRDGDEYVINGRKWWTTGAPDPQCKVLILMGKINPEARTYEQQSMIVVPLDTPGITIKRSLPMFGYQDQGGHGELTFEDVRVPIGNLLGDEGSGFALAQMRLGPGRIHHAMRAIGMAERGLEMMVRRMQERLAFGGPLVDQGVVREWIAESRMEIEQARLLVLKTAWLIDRVGAKGARTEIAAIKVIAPRVARSVLDRSIQAHGGGGVTDDFPLARMWATARILAIADGPDEVHVRSVARVELSKYRDERRGVVVANHDALGKSGTPFEFEVERGKVREFAQATGSLNPEYFESSNPPMPPTFLTTQRFWQTPTSNPWVDVEFSPARGLHAEQEFTFFGPPPAAGTKLTGTSTITKIYEKPARSGGVMTFIEMITQYTDAEGKVVAEAKMTGVETPPKKETNE